MVTKEKLFVEAMLNRSAEEIPTPDTGPSATTCRRRASGGRIRESPVGLAATARGGADRRRLREARQAFWAGRLDALCPVVDRGIARGELRPDTDAGLLLETLVAPLHGRLLLTGETVDEQLGERLVDLVLDGALRPAGRHP